MEPSECRTGDAVDYSPSEGRWFRGTVAADPWQLGDGEWVTKLTGMGQDYAVYTGKGGDKASTVFAASLSRIRPRLSHFVDANKLVEWLDAVRKDWHDDWQYQKVYAVDYILTEIEDMRRKMEV